MRRKQLDLTEIGFRLRKRREALELSREQVAAAAGVSVEVIAAAERGGRAFSLEQFRMISACLRVSADYLLFGEHGQGLVRQEAEHLSCGEE